MPLAIPPLEQRYGQPQGQAHMVVTESKTHLLLLLQVWLGPVRLQLPGTHVALSGSCKQGQCC